MPTKFVVGDTVWYLDVTYNAQPKIRQDVILRVDNFDVYCLKYIDKTIHIGKLYPTKEDLLASLEPEPHIVGYRCVAKHSDSGCITIKKVKQGDTSITYIFDSVEELLKHEEW